MPVQIGGTRDGTLKYDKLPRERVFECVVPSSPYAGRPFGDEAFVAAMEGRFQRKRRRSAADLVGEVAMSA